MKKISTVLLHALLVTQIHSTSYAVDNIFDFVDETSSAKNNTSELNFAGDTQALNNRQKSQHITSKEAKLIAINKTTASSQTLKATIDNVIFFHNLEIKLHQCVKIERTYGPEFYGLMTLTEYKVNDDPKIIFQGWLIGNNISLSNFEHPIYEIFLMQCL